LLIGDPLIDPRHGLEPLPGARAEVAALDRLLRRFAGDGVDIVLRCGWEASEREYRAHAGADLVHLACHAVVREPVSASGLYLAGGSDRLTPAEIAEIPLADALVFLSACDSGAGQSTLDGVIGIARSFLEAGARTVVMSAWTVDDLVAVPLVTGFYEELLGPNRRPVDMALAASIDAVRTMLRERRIVTTEGDALPDDPRLWAPLMVLGDGAFQYA
jgi:CHAT domain-containing protein